MAGRLWAFDVDGTLLDSTGTMRHGVRGALEAAHEAGDHVVLATGRSVAATRDVLDLLPWIDWAVCANGAATLHRARRTHEVVSHHALDVAPLVQQILRQDAAARMAVEDLTGTCWINEHFEPGELMGPFSRTTADDLGTKESFRMTIRPSSPGATFGLHENVDLLARPDIGRRTWFDLVAPGVNKATGLERVREALQVDPARTYAAGDESNDLEMVQWAAHSAAIGDRCAALGLAADRVLPSADQDGVLAFLEAART